jgi:hypothetical protein
MPPLCSQTKLNANKTLIHLHQHVAKHFSLSEKGLHDVSKVLLSFLDEHDAIVLRGFIVCLL